MLDIVTQLPKSGANLTNLPAANLSGGPSISGANLKLPVQAYKHNANKVIVGGGGSNFSWGSKLNF